MKKIIFSFFIILLLFLLYILARAAMFSSSQLKVETVEAVDTPPGAVDRFVQAIAIRTVSFANEYDFDSTQFEMFNEFIENNYPNVNEKLEHQLFSHYSHLYRWQGSDPSLKPLILMAHLDVVPIASPRKWSFHPFIEGVKNDTIYGRGAMDDKFSLISILEATEQLLNEGFQPNRTVYLAFGHDEEVSGKKGALQIVNYLKENNVEAELVLDEGSAITHGMIPNMRNDIALIGIAEKGYATMELRVDMDGGHSSSPPKETAIDVLSSAVSRVKQNPLPLHLTPAISGFIDKIGPAMDFKSKILFANKNIFSSLILKVLANGSGGTNASVRTTTAPTIFESGIKENIIPTSARALINFRIIPGETPQTVKDHVEKVVNDERIKVEYHGFKSKPSPISPPKGQIYDLVDRSIKEIFPNVLTSPSLVIAATDSRYFHDISEHVYRFTPNYITPENLKCFHGIDERISVEEYQNGIRFYRRVILNSDELRTN